MPNWVTVGAVNALLAQALGAFGAHALKGRIAPELLATFETGTRHHTYAALGLVLIGVLGQLRPAAAFHRAGIAMTLGIVLFSGSLYALAVSGIRWLGAITPVGGACLLAAWGLVAWGARAPRRSND